MERIMKYINRVYRASVLDRAFAFQEQNLKGHQLSYILQICRNPGLNQDELASRLFVNKSSVTRQLNQLEAAGYIRRLEAPEDRRNRRIIPTAKAEKLYPEIIRYLDSWNSALTDSLSPDEQETLLRLLRFLAGAASAKTDGMPLNADKRKKKTEARQC